MTSRRTLQRASISSALLILSACVTQSNVDAEHQFRSTIPTCSDEKDCEFKWAAARRWILSNPTMKLQHYAPDFMETFNPVNDGVGARVMKEPVDDKTYRIVVDAWCGGFACLSSMTAVKQSFNDYLNGKISAPLTLQAPAAKKKSGHPASR